LEYTGVTDWSKALDLDQWDGSDLFIVWPLPRYIVASSRAASIIRAGQYSGVEITLIEDMAPIEGSLSPGRLSYWLPQQRLAELAIPVKLR